MTYVRIASLIAACAAVTGIGYLAWSYFMPASGDGGIRQVGRVLLGTCLIAVAIAAGLVAGALWLIAGLPH